MRRPLSLVYALDESPPPHITLFSGIQFAGLIAINLVYALLVFRTADASMSLLGGLLAVGMLVLGTGTFLQALRLGPVGSGYMCPATFTATYFGPSLLAVQAGGLPLLFGMTIFAGVLEMALAPLFSRLRPMFPPEISGLVIFMIGLSGGIAGLRAMLGETGRAAERGRVVGRGADARDHDRPQRVGEGSGPHAVRADRPAWSATRQRRSPGCSPADRRPHRRRGVLGRPAGVRSPVMVVRHRAWRRRLPLQPWRPP